MFFMFQGWTIHIDKEKRHIINFTGYTKDSVTPVKDCLSFILNVGLQVVILGIAQLGPIFKGTVSPREIF